MKKSVVKIASDDVVEVKGGYEERSRWSEVKGLEAKRDVVDPLVYQPGGIHLLRGVVG
jgi:hypothetical protein